jgi:hypothetical protein
MTSQDARVTAERRPLFQHTDFSDTWKDAQCARTAFVRVHVEALIRRIFQTLAQADTKVVPGTARKAGASDGV